MRKPLVACIVLLTGMVYGGTYSGGDGMDNPYQISTVADWEELMGTEGDWHKHFILISNLDLAGITLTPVGNPTAAFAGRFDGSGHTVSNPVICRPENDHVGLFGFVDANGWIEDLSVADANMHGRDCVGAMVGTNNSGTLTACHATGTVGGTDNLGGLVGCNASGSITSCSAEVTVNGTSHVGGLVGSNLDGRIVFSCALGPVSGTQWFAGGLIGSSSGGVMDSCYARGSVAGQYTVGGLVGYNVSIEGNRTAIIDIPRDLMAIDIGTITACYATGSVTGQKQVGGLVGYNEGRVTACFWDVQTSSQAQSSAGRGLMTEDMQTVSVYQNAGWANKGWTITDGTGYPRLDWENTGDSPIPAPSTVPLTGNGARDDPYQVSTEEEFASLSWYTAILDKHIILTQDLDLGGTAIYPIGEFGQFTGVFDGKGHTISNVTLNWPGSSFLGLFAFVGPEARIENLTLTNAYVKGADHVGTLVGYNDSGTIMSCHVTGTVHGERDHIGGLIGTNDSGTISFCRTTAEVNGTYRIGGLVGYSNTGQIISCRTSEAAQGCTYVGGLVGYHPSGAITSCLGTGTVHAHKDSAGGLVGAGSGQITGSYATGDVSGAYAVGGLKGSGGGTIESCWATGQVECATHYAGGLVGNSGDTIVFSYATGHVSAKYTAGGLVGHSYYGAISSCWATGHVNCEDYHAGGLVGLSRGTITDCCAMGRVDGDRYVGGLVGYGGSSSEVTACFSAGPVHGTGTYVGGLMGDNYGGTITSSFWDIEVSGQTSSDGGIGRSTEQMQMLSTFENAGWDFVDTWRICEGLGYPRLRWSIPAGDFSCPDGVAWEDLGYLAGRWLMEDCGETGNCEGADLTGDGKVDMGDLSVLGEMWE